MNPDPAEKVAVVWATWAGSHPRAEACRLRLLSYMQSHLPPGSVMFLNCERQTIAAACTGLFQLALKGGAEWILFCDDDCLVPHDAFERLRSAACPATKPIVSALGFFRYPPYWPSIFKWDNWGDQRLGVPIPVDDYPEDSVIKVDATGLCCCLIHRSVFDRIPRPWFDHTSEGTPDGWFFANVYKAGLPVYCHTGVIVGHLYTAVADDKTFRSWCSANGGQESAHAMAIARWRHSTWTPPTDEELRNATIIYPKTDMGRLAILSDGGGAAGVDAVRGSAYGAISRRAAAISAWLVGLGGRMYGWLGDSYRDDGDIPRF
jgi:hypothetical protein